MKATGLAPLRRLDFQLLLVFLETMRLGKVGLVAESMGMTPSAVSHALARLRDVFGDPLFERRGGGVEPTRRARALLEPISQAVGALDGTMSAADPADLAQVRRVVRINALDHTLFVTGSMMGALARELPGLRLSLVTMPDSRALQAVTDGEIDLAIGVFGPIPPTLIASRIYIDQLAVAVRPGHPAVADAMTLDTYLAERHVVISHGGALHGPMDTVLALRNARRSVAAAVPSVIAALAMVADSDLIATVPRTLCRALADRLGVRLLPMPLVAPEFEVAVVRAPQTSRDPVVDWLLRWWRSHDQRLALTAPSPLQIDSAGL